MKYQIVSDGGAPRLEQVVEPHIPPPAGAPAEVRQFLVGQGWKPYWAINFEQWQRDGSLVYTWEQAMAIEFHRFINLGSR